MTPSDELLKPGFITFNQNFDTSISAVPHPAGQSELTGTTSRRGAIIYALNSATNDKVNPLVHVLAFLYQIVHRREGPR